MADEVRSGAPDAPLTIHQSDDRLHCGNHRSPLANPLWLNQVMEFFVSLFQIPAFGLSENPASVNNTRSGLGSAGLLGPWKGMILLLQVMQPDPRFRSGFVDDPRQTDRSGVNHFLRELEPTALREVDRGPAGVVVEEARSPPSRPVVVR